MRSFGFCGCLPFLPPQCVFIVCTCELSLRCDLQCDHIPTMHCGFMWNPRMNNSREISQTFEKGHWNKPASRYIRMCHGPYALYLPNSGGWVFRTLPYSTVYVLITEACKYAVTVIFSAHESSVVFVWWFSTGDCYWEMDVYNWSLQWTWSPCLKFLFVCVAVLELCIKVDWNLWNGSTWWHQPAKYT